MARSDRDAMARTSDAAPAEPIAAAVDAAPRRPRPHQRLFAWTLREAETREGAAGLFALAYLGSAFVPIALEPALIALAASLPHLWRRFVLCCAAGSILGGVTTYTVGYLFIESVGLPIIRFWGIEGLWERALAWEQEWGYTAVGIVAVGPGPTKLVSMAAGASGMPFGIFLAILVAGRLVRYFALGYFAVLFGERAKVWVSARHVKRVYAVACAIGLLLLGVYLTARALIP